MPGPCVEPSNCVHLVTNPDTANLRADLILDGDPANAAECGDNGLYIPKTRTRFTEQTTNPVGDLGSLVTAPFGVVTVDVDDFEAFFHSFPDEPIMITPTSTLLYTNDSGLQESVDFGVTLGETEIHVRAGWDISVGIRAGWHGPDLLPPVSAEDFHVGLTTGTTAFDMSYKGDDIYHTPLGVNYPPYDVRQHTVMDPGESLRIDYRLWMQHHGPGQAATGGGAYENVVRIYFGAKSWVRAWTRGG